MGLMRRERIKRDVGEGVGGEGRGGMQPTERTVGGKVARSQERRSGSRVSFHRVQQILPGVCLHSCLSFTVSSLTPLLAWLLLLLPPPLPPPLLLPLLLLQRGCLCSESAAWRILLD